MLSHRREIGPMYQKTNSFDGKIFSLNHFCTFDVFLALHLIKCEIEKQLQTSTIRRVIYRRALRPFCNGSELALKSLLHNGTTHVSWINVADCAHYRRGVVGGGGVAFLWDYTAVSVWLCEDRRSTSISGMVSSSGMLSAYSMEEVCESLLLSEDCFCSTAAREGLLLSQ